MINLPKLIKEEQAKKDDKKEVTKTQVETTDPETIEFNTEVEDQEPMQEDVLEEIDPEDFELQHFGFQDQESQTNYYDNLVDPFDQFISNGRRRIVELGADRGDFGKYINTRYGGAVTYKGYTDVMAYSNSKSVYFGNLQGFENSLTDIHEVDIIYYNLLLQKGNPYMMFGEVKTPLETFQYLTTSWDFIYDYNVKYSFFTISINNQSDVDLYKQLISFAVDMNMSFSSDYLADSRLINFIISH